MEIKEKVKGFILENIAIGHNGDLSGEISLLENGIIDSTSILELITFLEDEFGISIEDEEIIPENLDSLNNIEKFVQSKIQQS